MSTNSEASLRDGSFNAHPVTTDFSPGETRIITDVQTIVELQRRVEASVALSIKMQRDIIKSVDTLQGKMDIIGDAAVIALPSGMSTGTTHSPKPESLRSGHRGVHSHRGGGGPMNGQRSHAKPGPVATTSLGSSNHGYSDMSPVGGGSRVASNVTDLTDRVVGDHLPADWPQSLDFREIPDFSTSATHSHMLTERRGSSAELMSEASRELLSKSHTPNTVSSAPRWNLRDKIILNPNSSPKVAFDVCSLFVLLYDLTVIPFLIAWDLQLPEELNWMPWFTVAFWTCDICMTCITAVAVEGKLQKKPKMILRRYLRTWMIPDLLIVGSDWISLILTAVSTGQGSSSALKMLRFLKLGRLLRIAGVIKIFKFARVVEEFMDRTVGEAFRMSIKIMSMIFTILWLNHLISCGWFMLGRMSHTDTGLHWTDDVQSESIFLYRHLYQYATTFHWTMSQITLGASEIACKNSAERIYNIGCLVFGLVFSSTLVSSLSATMVQFQMLRNGRAQKLRMLRQFLKDNKVDLDVSYLVQKQVKDRLGPTDKLTDQDVPVLNVLSQSLLAELRFEVFQPWLISHPLFRLWAHMDSDLFCQLCFGLEFAAVREGDTFFSPGVAKPRAYILTAGRLEYKQRPNTAPVAQATTTIVQVKRWLCEPALWCEWYHVGAAEACVNCQFLVVDATWIHRGLVTRHIIRGIVQEYAEIFHQRTLAACPPLVSYPNDLHVPQTTYEDVVLSMRSDYRAEIGIDAIEQYEQRRWYFGQNMSEMIGLRREVKDGLSTAIVDGSGELMRVARIVALRVVRANGKMLVQLAKRDIEADGQLVAKCMLPGVKQIDDEGSPEAANRLLRSLRNISGEVTLEETKQESEVKNSQGYGVRTKYIRTTCTGRQVQPPKLSGGPSSEPMSVQRAPLEVRRLSSRLRDYPILDGAEIFVTGRKGKIYYYTWLTQHEFEELSHKSSSDSHIASALNGLEINTDQFLQDDSRDVSREISKEDVGAESDEEAMHDKEDSNVTSLHFGSALDTCGFPSQMTGVDVEVSWADDQSQPASGGLEIAARQISDETQATADPVAGSSQRSTFFEVFA